MFTLNLSFVPAIYIFRMRFIITPPQDLSAQSLWNLPLTQYGLLSPVPSAIVFSRSTQGGISGVVENLIYVKLVGGAIIQAAAADRSDKED